MKWEICNTDVRSENRHQLCDVAMETWTKISEESLEFLLQRTSAGPRVNKGSTRYEVEATKRLLSIYLDVSAILTPEWRQQTIRQRKKKKKKGQQLLTTAVTSLDSSLLSSLKIPLGQSLYVRAGWVGLEKCPVSQKLAFAFSHVAPLGNFLESCMKNLLGLRHPCMSVFFFFVIN